MSYDNIRLQGIIRKYILDSDNPDMINYGRQVAETPAWTIRALKHYMQLARMHESHVLDIGCGFGWDALIIALLGKNRVVCNDVRHEMASAIEQNLGRLRSNGISPTIEVLTGDICNLSFAEGSFDAVFCGEAIEHIRDLEMMFVTVQKILKLGGRGIFTNTNNLFNPKSARVNQKMWQLRETSWEYIEQLKKERPTENAGIEPYFVMRQRIIRDVRADLPSSDIERMTAATAGMIQNEIESLARDYTPKKKLPIPPPTAWCRDPVTGEFCEKLLDPNEVAQIARKTGLKAHVLHHHFNKFPLTILNILNNEPINRLVFYFRPSFTVVVEKLVHNNIND